MRIAILVLRLVREIAIEKRGLEMLVGYVRTIPLVAGDGVKRVSDVELKNAAKLRYWRPEAGPPGKR